MTLNEAKLGIKYKIVSILGPNRSRLAEMGFNPGCEIFLESKGFDEYSVVNCRGVKVALGKNQTKYISIAEIIPEEV